MSGFRCRSALLLVLMSSSLHAPGCRADAVQNLTGLPLYPNVNKAAMDRVSKTDKLGHWCSRFAAQTNYPLDKVQDWYRKELRLASETDLINDERYRNYPRLSGIKLALGIDYVTIFRFGDQVSTFIELVRCSVIG